MIPAAFCREVQGESAILLQFGTAEDAFRRKLPKGPYVTDILCPECDNWLNLRYEQQAIQALVKGRGVTLVHFINEDELVWRLDDVDLDRLKLFLLSILWRAHLTTMEPFRAFDLGPFAGRIQEMVLTEDPGAQNEFPVLPTRFDVRSGILMPHPFELEGVPYWEVNLGDWHFLVKASDLPTPPPFDACELRHDGAKLVIPRDYLGSGHHALMREMVLKDWNRRTQRRTDAAP